MGEKKSRTEEEVWIEEALIDSSHYKTTISDDSKKAEGLGRTSEESQERASDNWDKGETSSSSGCFISTACVESRGLPDNCEELNCLRHFRDKFVSNLPCGNELIEEYYRVAPKIVSAINGTKDPNKIYSKLFEELVVKTVSLINSGQKQEALSNGLSIVRDLELKYLR